MLNRQSTWDRQSSRAVSPSQQGKELRGTLVPEYQARKNHTSYEKPQDLDVEKDCSTGKKSTKRKVQIPPPVNKISSDSFHGEIIQFFKAERNSKDRAPSPNRASAGFKFSARYKEMNPILEIPSKTSILNLVNDKAAFTETQKRLSQSPQPKDVEKRDSKGDVSPSRNSYIRPFGESQSKSRVQKDLFDSVHAHDSNAPILWQRRESWMIRKDPLSRDSIEKLPKSQIRNQDRLLYEDKKRKQPDYIGSFDENDIVASLKKMKIASRDHIVFFVY